MSNKLPAVLKDLVSKEDYSDDMTFVIQLSQTLNIGTDLLYVGNIRELVEKGNQEGMNLYSYRYFQKISGWEGKVFYVLTVDFDGK